MDTDDTVADQTGVVPSRSIKRKRQQRNHRSLAIMAAESRWDDVIESASLATIDLNAVSELGRTALWLAAKEDRADVIEALLKAGADANIGDKEGNAPLSVAASAPIAAMLIERGANVNAANTLGQTALWRATDKGRADVVKALLQAGADVNKADTYGYAPLSVTPSATIAKMLIEHGADLNTENRDGVSALLNAEIEGRTDVVEALVQAGADMMADKSGELPLTVAAKEGFWSLVTRLARSNRHANVDALNGGKTALRRALVREGPEAREAATALICAGADVDFHCYGESLLRSVAYRWWCADNVLLLLAAGAATATAGVFAFDCCNRDVMVLMMAGGVVWTKLEIEQVICRFNEDGEDGNDSDQRGMVTLAGVLSQVPAAKKRIEKFGFAVIRSRVLEICIALQQLALPAPQLIEIVTQACAPFAAQLPYHYLWDAVVLVKHFHRRAKK
jgi:ankyrin repeat protein